MKIVTMCLEKISTRPTLGSFFILKGNIYYSTIKGGLDHLDLWRQIVYKSGLFDNLTYENKKELELANYATDRGRVTWQGEMKSDDTPDFSKGGNFVLYGTPASKKHREVLFRIFGLNNLPKDKVKEDWVTDPHYKIMETDKKTLETMIRLVGPDKMDLKNTRIAKVVEKTALREKITATLEKRHRNQK